MVEDPMNSSAPLGGGLVRSICSKAAMSFSQRSKLCVASADMAQRPTDKTSQQASETGFRKFKFITFFAFRFGMAGPRIERTKSASTQSLGNSQQDRRKACFGAPCL